MAKKLFLLDGMALVYRAHFAFMARPIYTSKGFNSSAIYGFTQTLLDLLKNQPTHLAVVFDTAAPTQRHAEFAGYKQHREAMPEDLSLALPHVRRMIEAFRIPALTCDGYEADDIIGALVKRAEPAGFDCFMVTPDKDFGQLVSEHVFIYKPSRTGEGVEVLGLPEILGRWGIQRPEQVIDILGLWGDASDNIPGVPGIGEKTAAKLIHQYGTIENLLDHTSELKGKLRENLETHREQALLSKRLATINCQAPCGVDLESLQARGMDETLARALCVEFEFNTIGRRLFGENFKAGRGFEKVEEIVENQDATEAQGVESGELELTGKEDASAATAASASAPSATSGHGAALVSLEQTAHRYSLISTLAELESLIAKLSQSEAFAMAAESSHRDPKSARWIGLAISMAPHEAYYLPIPSDRERAAPLLEALRPILENDKIEKIGHDLKFELNLFHWRGLSVRGPFFDVMLAHCLIEPDQPHRLEVLAETYLGYTPARVTDAMRDQKYGDLGLTPPSLDPLAAAALEQADLAGQLRPLLKGIDKGQKRVFFEIESPLIPVLAAMEVEGVRLDAAALNEFALNLGKEIAATELTVHQLAGKPFNLNSPKQLGEILFDVLKIAEKPKKTKTGQYATNEQTLLTLADRHPIIRHLLDHRAATKLKSTYAEALPAAIWPKTERVHTTFGQAFTATGRLQSINPNLQNIPIRSDRGKEIRKAFVRRGEGYQLLSADYSQIELRIIAALSRETRMITAFESGVDIHTATAARVFAVTLEGVTEEMRRKAKMVNYGIAYGISAFGLAQRLAIARAEAAAIIDQYFSQFPAIRKYMEETIALCRERGYVETFTGRRRYLPDIRSANATVRGAAERNAINMPIQGTAADMIKIAMIQIHHELIARKLRSRLLLQVHDELLFDLATEEASLVIPMVQEKMKNALPLGVPIVVDAGTGENWLEAH